MVSIVNSFVAVVVFKGASCLNMSLAVVYPCFSLLYIVTRCLILLIWKLVIKEIIFVLVSLSPFDFTGSLKIHCVSANTKFLQIAI